MSTEIRFSSRLTGIPRIAEAKRELLAALAAELPGSGLDREMAAARLSLLTAEIWEEGEKLLKLIPLYPGGHYRPLPKAPIRALDDVE